MMPVRLQVPLDLNNRHQRRWFFAELGRFGRRRQGVPALQREWRRDRARPPLQALPP